MLECKGCGAKLAPSPDGLYYEDDARQCLSCGATNWFGVEDLGEYEGLIAFVRHWVCRHDVDGDEPCVQCEDQGEFSI